MALRIRFAGDLTRPEEFSAWTVLQIEDISETRSSPAASYLLGDNQVASIRRATVSNEPQMGRDSFN